MKLRFAVGLLLALALVAPAAHAADTKPGELKPVRLATASGLASPITAYILVAQYLGYYKQEGLTLDLATPSAQGGGAVVQSLASGDAQSGTLGPGSVYLLDQQTQDVQLLGYYCYTQDIPEQLAVPVDSPIKTITDLKGKKIGVRDARRSIYSAGMLSTSGVSPDEVTYVPVGIGATPMITLQRHDVDALSMFDVDLRRVELLGEPLRRLATSDTYKKLQGPVLVATREEFNKDPALLIGFARGVAKGTIFMINNPEATAKIFYEMFPQAVPKGQEFKDVIADTTEMLKARVPAMKLKPGQKWGEMEPAAWEIELKFAGLEGKLHRPVTDFYSNALIDRINQFDQNAVAEQARNFDFDKYRAAQH